MYIGYELYNNEEIVLSGDDFRKLYDYMMFNGIEYIFNDISYDVDDYFNSDLESHSDISFAIDFKNGYMLFLFIKDVINS